MPTLPAARCAPCRTYVTTILRVRVARSRQASSAVPREYSQLVWLQSSTMDYYIAVGENMSTIAPPGNSCLVDLVRNSCVVMMNRTLETEVRY